MNLKKKGYCHKALSFHAVDKEYETSTDYMR